MNIEDMKPSHIILTVPPLTDTFRKSEMENAAALMIWILAHNGDTWRPVEPKEIEDLVARPEDKGWLNSMFSNPLIKFNFSQLVEDGYITREKAFTEKAITTLFNSRWRKLSRVEEIERVRQMEKQAEQRAVEMWRQGHPEREIVLPDRANLVLYLLERLDKLENRLVWYCPGCHEVGPIAKDQHKGQTCLCCFCEKAQAAVVSIPEALAGWDAR